jgi:hypothetical protein
MVRLLDTFVQGLDGIRTVRRLPAIGGWTVVIWMFPGPGRLGRTALGAPRPAVRGELDGARLRGLERQRPVRARVRRRVPLAAAKAVELFGVSPSAGLGFALIFHASQIVPVTVVGWLYFLREPISLGEAARPAAAPSDA